MPITQAKKELEKKRERKKQEKAMKREERKSNNDKGKPLEDMMVYVDENGQLTDVSPDKQVRSAPRAAGGGPRKLTFEEEAAESSCEGIVTLLFSDKGYGFISEQGSRSNVFVHLSQVSGELKLKDKVSFEKRNSPKGIVATNVRKIQ